MGDLNDYFYCIAAITAIWLIIDVTYFKLFRWFGEGWRPNLVTDALYLILGLLIAGCWSSVATTYIMKIIGV